MMAAHSRRVLTAIALTALTSCSGASVATMHVTDLNAHLTVRREPAHLYLPEYHRWLMIGPENGGDTALQLPLDTGGSTRINVYQTKKGSYVLVDRMAAYEAELSVWTVRSVPAIPDSKHFVGCFDVVDGRWTFLSASERSELQLDLAS